MTQSPGLYPVGAHAPAWTGTQQEFRELLHALSENFESCSCHRHVEGWSPGCRAGRVWGMHLCAAHEFVMEQENSVTRPQRMLFVRRMRGKFITQEGLPDQANIARIVDDKDTLPW